jgi:hypothetical protein
VCIICYFQCWGPCAPSMVQTRSAHILITSVKSIQGEQPLRRPPPSSYFLFLFPSSYFFFFFLFSGTTVQCGPLPPSWTSSSQLWFLTSLSKFAILHLLMSVCIQFYQMFFGHPLSWLPWGLFLNTSLNFLLLSILLTRPIQFKRHILTNKNIFNSQNSLINSLLYRSLQFSFTLIPPQLFLKTFLSKVASHLEILLFSVQDFALRSHRRR